MKSKNSFVRAIINADDLGISLSVNKQIEDCIKRGVVSSTTLLVNAPAFADGVRIAKSYPHVSVGIHLNLIEFAPLTNVDVFKEFGVVGSDGNFVEGAIFVANCRDKRLRKAVFEEWDAQITKFEAAGLKPTHIDSHEHTHTIIPLQDVLCAVMDKHGINRVRRKTNPSIRLMLRGRRHPDTVHLDKSKAIVRKKRNVVFRRFHVFVAKYYSIWWNHRMSKRYVLTDSFYAFRVFLSNRDIIPTGKTVELMCHPGHKSYQSETESLLNPSNWNKEVSIISYNDLVINK